MQILIIMFDNKLLSPPDKLYHAKNIFAILFGVLVIKKNMVIKNIEGFNMKTTKIY